MIFYIEADQREKRNVVIENSWVVRPYTEVIAAYMATLRDHPNPPAVNVTVFQVFGMVMVKKVSIKRLRNRVWVATSPKNGTR